MSVSEATKAFMSKYWGPAAEYVDPQQVETALTAALPFLTGVKVKALTWIDPSKETNGCWIAKCEIGTYSVVNENGWYAVLDEHAWGTKGFEWASKDLNKDTRQTAFDAAQADYEDRILSAIEFAPSPRAQALEEAAKIAFDVSENGEYYGEASVDSTSSIYQQGAFEVYEAIRALSPHSIQFKNLPKEKVSIPDPNNPDARIVGFRIREGDEAWGDTGLSEPLFWLDRFINSGRALSSHPVADKKIDEFVAYRFKHRNDGPHMWEYYPLPVGKSDNGDFVTQALTLKKLLAIMNSDQHADRQSQSVVGGWLPIETAPKDGTCVLVWKPDEPRVGEYIFVAFWDDAIIKRTPQWVDVAGRGLGYLSKVDGKPQGYPTHWHPLPASPGASE